MKNYESALDYLTHVGNLQSASTRTRALANLKQQGLSISQAIKAVRAVANVSLGQAKEWVSSSAAWRDVAAQSKPLHDDAIAVIDSLPSLAPRERMRAG